MIDLRCVQNEAVKLVLGPLLHWKPMKAPAPGFSIILSAPWALRQLLKINLSFIEKTDITSLESIHIVFDRAAKPDGADFIRGICDSFPNLPLKLRFYPSVAGRVVEIANTPKFYHALCCIVGLQDCTTKYAVLHDFDLYPLVPDFFTNMVDALQTHHLRFSGRKLTDFDGLTEEDGVIGTDGLAIDVEWLRERYRPEHCFHRITRFKGRKIYMDPFTYLQLRTPERRLSKPTNPDDCFHVTNLCEVFLRTSKGTQLNVGWRFHSLWYLESLSGNQDKMRPVTEAMRRATSSRLEVHGSVLDFAMTHVTCSNVLFSKLSQMETTLFGGMRPQVADYSEEFRRFLNRFGDAHPL